MSMSEDFYRKNYETTLERTLRREHENKVKKAAIKRSEVGTVERVQGNGASRRQVVEIFSADRKGKPVRRLGRKTIELLKTGFDGVRRKRTVRTIRRVWVRPDDR